MMRLVAVELIAGLSSAGMMTAGGMMAEADPAGVIGGNAAGVIYGGIATAIITGIGAIISGWYGYDLKRRESDRLDKTSTEKMAAIEARATEAEAATDQLRKELENSKNNWHEERKRLGDQLDRSAEQLEKAYGIVEKVSNQLAALNHQARNNAVMIDVTRREVDLPPLNAPPAETAS